MRAPRPLSELIWSATGVFIGGVAATVLVYLVANAEAYFGSPTGFVQAGTPLGVESGRLPFLAMLFALTVTGGCAAIAGGPLVFAARWTCRAIGGRFSIAVQFCIAALAVCGAMLLIARALGLFEPLVVLWSIVTAAVAVVLANWLSSQDRQEEPCAS